MIGYAAGAVSPARPTMSSEERCKHRRQWTVWQCIRPAGHDGDHLDWQQAGLEDPYEEEASGE